MEIPSEFRKRRWYFNTQIDVDVVANEISSLLPGSFIDSRDINQLYLDTFTQLVEQQLREGQISDKAGESLLSSARGNVLRHGRRIDVIWPREHSLLKVKVTERFVDFPFLDGLPDQDQERLLLAYAGLVERYGGFSE